MFVALPWHHTYLQRDVEVVGGASNARDAHAVDVVAHNAVGQGQGQVGVGRRV